MWQDQVHAYFMTMLKVTGCTRIGHEDPDGEYSYSSTVSLTSGLDEGGRSTPRPGRFTPGKGPLPIL